MKEISNEGAKVLHNRCVEIGEKFGVPIIAKSTFNDKKGTIVSDSIENNEIKSIVKKEVSKVSIIGNGIIRNFKVISNILKYIEDNKLEISRFEISEIKILIIFKEMVDDKILENLHKTIFYVDWQEKKLYNLCDLIRSFYLKAPFSIYVLKQQ